MNALPVILRELRAEARNPFTHTLRLIGGTILLALLAFFWLTTVFSPDAGPWLFARLHQALFLAIWILVPLVTADCLSRERRERTLGLLFLTPLRPLDIVVAKGLVHGLRALTLWFSVLPVLAVPLLMGGVNWVTVLGAALVNASAICWALSAGLLGSALSKSRSQALAVSSCLFGGFFFLFGALSGLIVYLNFPSNWVTSLPERLALGVYFNAQLVADGSILRFTPAGFAPGRATAALLASAAEVTGFSVLALGLTQLAAARALRLVWQEKPDSAAWLWFYRVFCTPFIWRAFFDRWLRRKLEKNPIGWLEQRQWTGRTASGAWLAVIISLYIVMLQDSSLYHRVTTQVQTAMAWMLAGSMAVSAAGSFRRERELGVMELLLVTPLGPQHIALGRLRGIWEQFLPAIAMLFGVWIYVAFTFGHRSDWVLIVFTATAYAGVPVAGLHYSLTHRSFIGALVWTFLTTLLLPLLLPVAGAYVRNTMSISSMSAPMDENIGWFLAAGIEAIFAGVYWWRLQVVLRERAFPIEVR